MAVIHSLIIIMIIIMITQTLNVEFHPISHTFINCANANMPQEKYLNCDAIKMLNSSYILGYGE